MRSIILLASLLALLFIPVVASSISDEFDYELRRIDNDSAALALIKAYLPKAQDVDDYRKIQNLWLKIDRSACTQYFNDLYHGDPASADYHYLWARGLDDGMTQLIEARKLITAHPNYYWGYRLIQAAYQLYLFNPHDVPEELIALFGQNYPRDKELLVRSYTLYPNDDYTLYTMYEMSMWSKDFAEAERYLMKPDNLDSPWLKYAALVRFAEKTQRLAPLKKHLPILITNGIASGNIQPSDSIVIYVSNLAPILVRIENWQELEVLYKDNPQLTTDPNTYGPYISLLIARDDHSGAIDLVTEMFNRGVINYRTLVSTREWLPLVRDHRWVRLLYEAKLKWDNEEPIRRSEVLSGVIRKPAPDWELPTPEGIMVKLSDLKGQIVILDFWATWCDPCRRLMPILSNWVQKQMPEGVEVFSINIWETDADKALAYFQENKFAMTLLYGFDNLAAAYGVEGIPHLVVIDQDGFIRFEESGFNANLDDNLNYWMQFLLESEK